jgi:uncharacterized integral membrane protein
MRIFYIVLLIILVIAAVVFAVQNSAPVTIAFLGFSTNASMSIVLVLTFAAGIMLGMFLLLPSVWKRMRALSVLKKKQRQNITQETPSSPPPDAASDKVTPQDTTPLDRAP